ncbi:MAG: hypothetical protein JSR44_07655 [Spirochaetes bacterium]|nr:hypothetical protein [Spirochaetota bacterium]
MRWRFYFKLSAVLASISIVGFILFFILRIEKFILARLPKEISVEKLSVSLINRAFVLEGAQLRGRAGTSCENKILADIKQLTGKFNLRARRLTELTLSGATLYNRHWDKVCFVQLGEAQERRFADYAMPEGLKVTVKDLKFSIPEFNEVVLHTKLQLQETASGALSATAIDLNFGNRRITGAMRRLNAEIQRRATKWNLERADIVALVQVRNLEKIDRLRTHRLTVLGGDAYIAFSAEARGEMWQSVADVELRRLEVKGSPIYKAPMGLGDLTPQSIWPMIEDTRGRFAFACKSHTTIDKLAATISRDCKRALAHKVRKNLKKKFPILPLS